MVHKLKLIFTGIIISLFTVQAALACACAYEDLSTEHQHSNHHEMMDHDNMSHQACEEPCVASTLEIDDEKFSFIADVSTSFDQKLILETEKPFYVAINTPKKRTKYLFPPALSPPDWSLYAQGILLLI